MARKTIKKGPHTVTASKSAISKEEKKFQADVNSFIRKVHRVIQQARAKMTDKQVEKADREAAAILRNASDAPTGSRRAG